MDDEEWISKLDQSGGKEKLSRSSVMLFIIIVVLVTPVSIPSVSNPRDFFPMIINKDKSQTLTFRSSGSKVFVRNLKHGSTGGGSSVRIVGHNGTVASNTRLV